MPIFTTEIDADGVATIAWDLPGRSMNVLTDEGIAELDAAMDAALADPAVKGIVITSGKPDFAGGMDLNLLAKMKENAGADPARGLFDDINASFFGVSIDPGDETAARSPRLPREDHTVKLGLEGPDQGMQSAP